MERFAAALKAGCSSLILAHSHPSGNLAPSQADIKLTRKLKEAGNFLDLPVLDHIIISAEAYYSFAAAVERTKECFSIPFFLLLNRMSHGRKKDKKQIPPTLSKEELNGIENVKQPTAMSIYALTLVSAMNPPGLHTTTQTSLITKPPIPLL